MRLFKFALPVLFATGLALLAARAWTDQADAAAHKLSLEHARHQFSQRAAVVRAAPDPARYRDDLRALLRAWFADVAEIGNRFPMLRGQQAAFVPPPPRVRGGNLGDWQQLSQLDEPEAGKQVQRLTVPLLFKGLALRFFDASGKLVARLDGAGEPALRLDMPERLTADAPPGLVLGHYELPQFPAGAAEVEWTLSAQLRTVSGDTRLAQATWKTKLDPAWTGAAWTQSAGEKVVAESEIEAKAAAPETQAAAQPAGRKPRAPAWPVRE